VTVNKVILVGNLGRDPEIRHTTTGSQVASLSIATTDRQKDRDGNWTDKTEWHRVSVFGRAAESVGKYLKKGRQVYIEGKLETRKWQDQSGSDRYSTEVIVARPGDVVRFLGRGDGDAGSQQRGGGGYSREPSNRRPSQQQQQQQQQQQEQGGDDDIPF